MLVEDQTVTFAQSNYLGLKVLFLKCHAFIIAFLFLPFLHGVLLFSSQQPCEVGWAKRFVIDPRSPSELHDSVWGFKPDILITTLILCTLVLQKLAP